jgi:hypothetical protein
MQEAYRYMDCAKTELLGTEFLAASVSKKQTPLCFHPKCLNRFLQFTVKSRGPLN